MRRATSTDFLVSLVADDFSRASNTYVGKLRSNFLGTKFTIYDSQSPTDAAIQHKSRHSRRFSTKQVSPKLPAYNYSVATISYELNVLRTRALFLSSTLVFYLSTLPNTLVMGIPLLKGMYGADSGSFMYRGARSLISEQFPDTTASIISFRIDTDVISLDGKEPLETQVEVGEDGKLHVNVRKSTSSRSENCIQWKI
ncbi:hypothetical protein SASPL_136444 [Salvia splendens]|uniref:Tubby C-terminal domain-containing protein n=1 Tax=Salvia splendens TaxID=180675 RepID=A0A8X8ZHJ1_SALSN|nr:hypothetical protein SASPL_136444 [Salvia splendens]